MSPCRKCQAKCCRYFALEIDTPTSREDIENIRWFLAHKSVKVFVEKRKWYLEIGQECRYLTKDHMCSIYEDRPLICREHEVTDCEHTSVLEHDIVFNDLEEFDVYIKKRKRKRSEVRKRAREKKRP